MSTKQVSKIRVRALRSYTRDVGKNIARVDPKTMELLDISPGGVLEVVGLRRTVCKCMPLFKSDPIKDIVRIDGLVRENAGLEVGDEASIRKIEALPAQRISLAPLAPSTSAEVEDDQIVRESLGGLPFVLGDQVMIQFGLDNLPFIILDASPKAQGYLINEMTSLEVLPSII